MNGKRRAAPSLDRVLDEAVPAWHHLDLERELGLWADSVKKVPARQFTLILELATTYSGKYLLLHPVV